VRHGCSATVVMADIAQDDDCQRLVEAAFTWRPIAIWVNNAGADVLTGDKRQLDFLAKLELLWQTDVLGTIRLSRLFGERTSAASAALVNIGWDQAELGMEGEAGQMFSAAKGAIMAFSKSLSKSLAPRVRVNCVAPGWIRTQWAEHASARWQQRAQHESCLGRWGTPQDVASA